MVQPGESEFYETLDRDKFADWMLNSQRPDGTPNTTRDYIDEEVVKELWDMAVAAAENSPGVQGAGVAVIATWWATGGIQGYVLAKLEEEADNGQAG